MSCSISVVTVTYNSSSLLEGFLSRLMQGREPGDEVIIVDSGSGDSADARRAAVAAGAHFVGLKDNVGFGTASDVGALRAKGEYIAFVNPDVETTFEDLQKLAKAAKDGRFSCVGPLVRDASGNFAEAERGSIRSPLARLKRQRDIVGEVESIAGCCMIVDAQTFREIGGFDPHFFMFAEEIDLHRRIRAHGGRLGVIQGVVVVTEGGGSSSDVETRWSKAERQVAHVRYVRKWFGRRAALVDAIWRVMLMLRRPEYKPLFASLSQFVRGLRGSGSDQRRHLLERYGVEHWD